MTWIAPAEKDASNGALEKRLWDAAEQFHANSGLKSPKYSAPVLGLIFLRFAESPAHQIESCIQRGGSNPSPLDA